MLETRQEKEEIRTGPCPYHKSSKSHHCLAVLSDGAIMEDIYLHNDCNEYNAERVLLHESIHATLYHFLDEKKFRNSLPKLINDNIDLNEYMKKEFVSEKYDNPSKFVAQSENWFSSLLENWNSQEWIFTVNLLMKIRWKE